MADSTVHYNAAYLNPDNHLPVTNPQGSGSEEGQYQRSRIMYRASLLILLFPLSLYAQVFDHSVWGDVLTTYVDDQGFVDYQALSKDRMSLDLYLDQINRNGPESTPELFPNRHHQLAYYINAYNALVFEGVLSRGPETSSVWRGLISGFSFFTLMDVRLDGRTTSLKRLEDDIIRERFRDPRIHAAINCASVSCPRLPTVPFHGDHLDAQLDVAMEEFVNDTRHVQSQGDRVYLSRIFDWFESDFENNGMDVISYINRFRPPETQLSRDLDVRFLKYDKRINQQR